MQLPDDDPVLMLAWHLGKGFQHMRHEHSAGLESAEFLALEKFWQDVASVELNRENATRLLELAKAIPDFPAKRLQLAEQQLALIPADSNADSAANADSASSA